MTTAPPRSLVPRIPALLGLLAAAVFAALSLSTNAATRFYQWPWFFYWQVLLVSPIALLAGRLLAGRPGPRRFGGWLDSSLGLLAAGNVGAALFSPFRPQSLNAALIPIAAASLAYLELDWIERDPVRREGRITLLARLMGMLMFLFTVESLGRWLFAHVLPAWTAGRPLGDALAFRNADPLGHSVYTAGFAVLAAPWLAVLGLTTRGLRRGFWFTAAALALALVPTTDSRGGVLALIVALACTAAFWLAQSSLSHGGRLLVTAGVLLAAAILVGLDPRLRSLVLNWRWNALASESNRQRTAMLEAGWLMGRDRPLTGFGPGTVPLVYPRYRARLSGGVDDVLQLHNTPAQLWAELGAPGVIAALLLLVGVAGRAGGWRGRPDDVDTSPQPAHRLLTQAAIVSFAGYAVMCLADYQLDVPLFATVGATLLALLRTCTRKPAEEAMMTITPLLARRSLGALLLAALVVILWPMLPNLRARWLFADAATAREAGRPDVFVAGTESAAAAAPWDAFYPVQLGAFYGEQYLQASDRAAQMRARQLCAAALNRALAINPDQEYCHFNFGWLLLPEDPAAAEPHFRAAAHLVPDKGGVYLGLGLSLLARNEKSPAADAFALEWLNDPQAIASPFWNLPPLTALRSDVAVALHREIAHWLEQKSLPAAIGHQLRYVAALADWWLGATPDVATLGREGSPEPRQFFENLRLIDQRTYVPRTADGAQPWERLYIAWHDMTSLAAAPGDTPEFVSAINRRLLHERDSFARLLVSPSADDPALEQTSRRRRLAYNVLMRNQDGFLLSDLYVFPENRLVQKYASFLFPSKGYLPGWLLLASLDRLAPAPR